VNASKTFPDPATVPAAEIPATIGRLEEYKAALYSRLATPAPATLAPAGGLLTVEEVAERLAMTEARIYEMARTGELPSLLIGRLRRFEPEAIAQWLATRRSGGRGSA